MAVETIERSLTDGAAYEYMREQDALRRERILRGMLDQVRINLSLTEADGMRQTNREELEREKVRLENQLGIEEV